LTRSPLFPYTTLFRSSLRVVTQEQFGPVIPIIPFDTEEEAVRAANDTWAGLCGSVWTANPEAAQRVGSQLVCGYVWVNDHGATRDRKSTRLNSSHVKI